MKIKKGDNVLVIAGKDRGKAGKVILVLPKEEKIVVEGINKFKKHTKPKRQGEKGQRIEQNRPFSVSNVLFICPKCNKAVKLGTKINENKKHFRICRKCKETI